MMRQDLITIFRGLAGIKSMQRGNFAASNSPTTLKFNASPPWWGLGRLMVLVCSLMSKAGAAVAVVV